METNKKLQTLIGSLIGKDYFNEYVVTEIHDKLNNGQYWAKIRKQGQEPTLNDVLLAIGKKYGDDAWEYAIDCSGNFLRDLGESRHETTGDKYDLEKSIFNQSEETKVAIINLLEGK